MINNKQTLLGHLLAIITIFVWGVTYISTKVLLDTFTPIQILFIRFLIGIITLFIACPHFLKLKCRKHEIYFMAAGFFGVTLYYLIENIALKYTTASNVGVIISAAPFFIAILTKIVYKNQEKLNIFFFIGFIVAIIGICLISLQDVGNISVSPLGDFLALIAGVAWAFYSIFIKKIGGFGYSNIQTTRRIFIYGTLFMIPFVFIDGFCVDINKLLYPTNIINILFLGIIACAVCFATWSKAVSMLGVVKTSVYIYMIPVITVVTSVIILGEEITLIKGIGVILAMTGLFISEKKYNSNNKRGQD